MSTINGLAGFYMIIAIFILLCMWNFREKLNYIHPIFSLLALIFSVFFLFLFDRELKNEEENNPTTIAENTSKIENETVCYNGFLYIQENVRNVTILSDELLLRKLYLFDDEKGLKKEVVCNR